MPSLPTALAIALFLLLPAIGAAAAPSGLSFADNNWQLACDNTRTCRAAGYHRDGDEQTVSVLLVREAGAGRAVTGQVMVGRSDEEAAAPQGDLVLRIGGRELGAVASIDSEGRGDLTAAQVDAVLQALASGDEVAFVAGERRWQLSDEGASAVLRKMDEFQGRVGTSAALVRKGGADESQVLPALPPPVVVVAMRPATTAADQSLATDPLLRRALMASVDEDDCSPPEAGTSEGRISVERLSANELLVSLRCWANGFSVGEGYWVVADAPPYAATLVTMRATDYSNGEISSSQKERGSGDCWSSNRWSWDGKTFVHTAEATTGQCKLVAADGVWHLPTIVTTVRQATP